MHLHCLRPACRAHGLWVAQAGDRSGDQGRLRSWETVCRLDRRQTVPKTGDLPGESFELLEVNRRQGFEARRAGDGQTHSDDPVIIRIPCSNDESRALGAIDETDDASRSTAAGARGSRHGSDSRSSREVPDVSTRGDRDPGSPRAHWQTAIRRIRLDTRGDRPSARAVHSEVSLGASPSRMAVLALLGLILGGVGGVAA